MAEVVGRRGCSGMINLGISIVLLLGLAWFFTQDRFSFDDLKKVIDKVSGPGAKIVLQVMPIVDDSPLTKSDVLVVNIKRGLKRHKNIENKYEIYLAYKSVANNNTSWEVTLTTLYKDGHEYVKTSYNRKFIFVLVKDFVYALKRSDGSTVWSLRLRDQVSPSCSNCMALIERKLVLLTEDRILHSINMLNGNILWKTRLNTPKAKDLGFYNLKDKIVLSDQIDVNAKSSASIFVMNPIKGVPIRFFTPTPHRKIDSGKIYTVDMPVVFDKIATHAYLMPEGTHIQCWDIDNARKKWDRVLPARVLLPDKVQNLQYIEHQTSLYLSATAGTRHVLLKVSLLDGKITELAREADYSLVPIAGLKNLVFSFTQKTRGNKRSEVWGMNNDNGTIAWRYNLRANDLYNQYTKKGNIFFVLHKDGLLVIQHLEEHSQLLVEKLNPMNGNLIKKTVKDISGNQWNDIKLTDHKVYFSMDEVYELDLKTTEVKNVDY